MSRRETLSTLAVVLAVSMALVAPVSAATTGAQTGAAAIDSSEATSTPSLDTRGHSIQISSESGVDGAVNQSVAVEPNTTYALSGWIKTENVQPDTGFGAQLNVHQLGQDSLTESVTGTQGWTYVETTVNSGDNEQLQINALLGGWGTATGTAYYDDVRFENPQGENLLANGDLETGSLDSWSSQTWTGSAEYGITDEESVATGEVSSRTVEDDAVQPGESTLVTVDVETSETTNFTVVEHFDPAFENVEIVDADGAVFAEVRDADDAVFATYTDRDKATLTYRVTLGNSSSLQEDDRYSLSGFTHSDGDRSATGGQDRLTVGTANPGQPIGQPLVQSERTVDTEDLQANGTATVRVNANPGEAADFIIYEDFDPAFESVEIVDADGTNVTGIRNNETLFAAYSDRQNVTLVYEVEVGSASSYALDGHTNTHTTKGTFDHGTLGTDTITVSEASGSANFQVSDLDAPDSATQGNTFDVSANVTNDGDEEATQTVEFRFDIDGDGTVDDDEVTASQEVTLDGGETQTVTFSDIDTARLLPGDHVYGVFTDDDSATATITIGGSDLPASETSVSLSPESAEVAVGDTETYDVTVDNADGGVGAFELTVSLDDASAASITDVTIAGNPDLTDVSYAEDNSSVTIRAALMDTADTGSVSIASIAVEGTAEGSSDLSVDVEALGNESGESYTVTDENGASISVSDLQPVGDFQDSPTDPDGDGLYEDIDGDGNFTIVDVQALFANLDDDTIQNNPDRFDFNQNGVVNVVDVQKLFNELLG